MLRNKEKGQGLLEFALILPLLLLLLVGIVEASRLIWAFITVQTAAREAARYAISGRPYVNFSYTENGPGGKAAYPNSDCLKPEGTSGEESPWVCDPSLRVEAIKMVALNRISTTINHSEFICDSPAEFSQGSSCETQPGAIGVLVIGQYTDLLTPSLVLTATDHPGDQGLNVRISTFLNVQMIDPIFDVIVKNITPPGRNFIQLRGELSMQNEGIAEALGGVPPPEIQGGGVVTGTGSGGTGPSGEQIWALNYRVNQGGSLPLHLENHFYTAGPYDIYLRDSSGNIFKICTAINTEPATNNGDFSCSVGLTPPGFYDLFSTLTGSTAPLATAPQQVEIAVGSAPQIQVDNGLGSNIVTPNTIATVNLLAHQTADEPFDIFLVFGAGPTVVEIIPDVQISVVGTALNWLVPTTLGNPCPPSGTAIPCTIQSRKQDGTIYASGELYITSPQLVLGGNNMSYFQGEIMYIYLRSHTPGATYNIKISNGTDTVCLGPSETTNVIGDTTNPTPSSGWPIAPSGSPGGGLSDGIYKISSHPADVTSCSSPTSLTTANEVATLNNVNITTPPDPYITVDGGYNWPAGSFINIRAFKHPQASNPYYFKFGPWRVPIAGSSPVDTFNTNGAQTYVTGYRVPLTATTGVTTTYFISSFVNAGDVWVAERSVNVSPVPIITVLEGSPVLPDTTISIRLTDHAPNSSHQIIYANKLLGEVLTDAGGQALLKYDLKQLPLSPPPDLSNPANYGIPFDLYSVFKLTGTGVATTQLALKAADLHVTNVQVPASPQLNQNNTITFTIQNTSTVPISRFFDIDLYLDPAPLTPAYRVGQFNAPGDFKLWRNSVPPAGQPGSTFTISQPFFFGTYGTHTLFGYADTSNFVFNEPNEVNNVLSNTLTINCTPTYITDNFANSSSLSSWVAQWYGDGDDGGTGPQVSSGSLFVTSDGTSTTQSNDNSLAPQSGYTFFRRTTPITTAGGLDMWVQVKSNNFNTTGAKAGLEVRDTTNATSPKIEFGLTRFASGGYRIQAIYRDSVVPNPVLVYQNSADLNLSTPIWLRIQRYGGTNTFLFSFVQAGGSSPTWGAPVASAKVNMSNQLEFGLFMNNGRSGSHDYVEFDNFAYGNPASCPAAQGQPPTNNAPPGLTQCTDPLQQKSFENPPLTKWVLGGAEGVAVSPGSAHTGNYKLSNPTFDSQFHQPYFYQQFAMPTFVISSTSSLRLTLFKNIDPLSDGNDANDRFFAVVTTGPTLGSTQVTNPVEIANGDIGGVTYSPIDWRQVDITLPLALGVNLETYAGQNLYLHFYNQSNASCVPVPPFTGCHATLFNFDDVTLSPCTTQPLPPNISTRLKGELVLHFLGGSTQKIAGIKVSAYSEGGQLYETVTIQNGEFNFYNLPATTAGTKYFLYAEYYTVNSSNPNLIEILSANSTAVVASTNDNANPATTRLDLFTTSP